MTSSFRLRKPLRSGTAILALAAGLAACGGSPAKTTAKLSDMTVAVVSDQPAYAQLYAAKAGGFFEAQGLNVNIVGAGQNIDTELVSGRALLAAGGVGP